MSRRSLAGAALGFAVLVAGCSSAAAPTTASTYDVCITLTGPCSSLQMRARPAVMDLSQDGAASVRQLAWHDWGTATATGTGTAWLDNCKPSCVQGTFAKHPATVVLTRPESWHGQMAYTRALVSIPATGFRQRYPFAQTSLLPVSGMNIPSPSSPPAPGPVSTQASLSSTCEAGYEPAYNSGYGSVAYGPFTQGPPGAPVTIGSTEYTAAPAYRVSFTNTGSTTAEVTGWAVAFYDASGSELGSDQESATGTFITAGQTLSGVVYSSTDTAGNGLSGSGAGIEANSLPAGAATCQVVQWYHP